MPRLLLTLLAIYPLGAQLLIDTYMGGVIRTGVPANSVAIPTISGLTWDPSGNIVFCDVNNSVIRRVAPNGIITTIAGTGVTGFAGDGGPAVAATINHPSGVQSDASGNLYFFDAGNYRIRRVDTSGIITTVAGDGEALGPESNGAATSRSIDPLYFTVTPTGIIYLSDNGGNLLRVDTSGNLEIFAQLPQIVPGGLATDAMGNVYFLNQYEDYYQPQTLYRISPSGVVSTFATFPAANPNGPPPGSGFLTSDLAGNIYAFFNSQLLRYAPDGSSTVRPAPSALSNSGSVTIDASGNIAFVTTITPDVHVPIPVIQKFSPPSTSTTVAGANPQPAPDGTPLSQAWFLNPTSIAFSHTGDLYIAEFGACLIRKISASGVLSTFAGTGTCGYPAPTGTAASANLVYPGSIAIDSQDNVWVADDFLNLYSISQQGVLSPMIKSPVAGGTGQLAIDAQNRVCVLSDFLLYRVLSGGSYQQIIPGSGITLAGIGADSSGNVYFGITQPRNVYVVNNDGSTTLKYPSFGGGAFSFDPSGNIWASNGGLATFNSTGIANIGSGPGFAGDGGPAQSALISAGSMAFGPDGNLYFVEGGIRRITGSGPSAPPVISQNGIVNAVSYAGGSIAPGELISIFGSNFGAASLQVNAAVNNSIPRTIGRTKVLFNNFLGAITAITPTQINVFVPYEVTGPVNVQVQVDNILSPQVSMSVAPTAPGFSTSILNQDGTVNSSTNPAARGSIVSFYGTGLGQMMPQLNDGNLAISTPYSTPLNAPALTIASQSAQILYAGDAPTLPTEVFQINAEIPATINPGQAAVSLTIAGASAQVSIFLK